MLLAAYGFTFFLPNITRYKSLILFLLFMTAIAKVVRGQSRLAILWQSTSIRAVLLLTAAVLYGCAISPDPVLSLNDARKPVFIDCLLVGLSWPLALQDRSHARTAIALIAGFAAGLAALLLLDLHRYYTDFVEHAIGFGSTFEHRELSYGLLVTMPFALVALRRKEPWIRSGSFLLVIAAAVCLMGTLARGAWLAGFAVVALWTIRYRTWKFAALVGLLVATLLGAWTISNPDSALAGKARQTDSSHRWNNGVQSATLDLIMENPWHGYGFGDEIYASVYNARVTAHPEWTVRESIGPHNMTLRMWMASGSLGLVAILALYFAIIRDSLRAMRNHLGLVHDAAFAVLLAFVGAVLVRGLFESAYMNYFGWMVGMLTLFNRDDTATIKV